MKEEALLRHTADKIKNWLTQDMLVFLISPTPEDTVRMKHLLAGYNLPVQILPADSPLLTTHQ